MALTWVLYKSSEELSRDFTENRMFLSEIACLMPKCRGSLRSPAVQNGLVIPEGPLTVDLHGLGYLQHIRGKPLKQREFQHRGEHADTAALPHAISQCVECRGKLFGNPQVRIVHNRESLIGRRSAVLW